MTEGDQEDVAKVNTIPNPRRGLPPRKALLLAGVPAFLGVQRAPSRLLLPEADFRGRVRVTASRGSAQPAPLSSPPLPLTLRRRAGILGSCPFQSPSPRSPNFCASKAQYGCGILDSESPGSASGLTQRQRDFSQAVASFTFHLFISEMRVRTFLGRWS